MKKKQETQRETEGEREREAGHGGFLACSKVTEDFTSPVSLGANHDEIYIIHG